MRNKIFPMYYLFYKISNAALADVAQWVERQTAKQRVTGSIPSQPTCLGCRPGPQWAGYKRQPHTDISLPLFLPPFPSLKINFKIFFKNQ